MTPFRKLALTCLVLAGVAAAAACGTLPRTSPTPPPPASAPAG